MITKEILMLNLNCYSSGNITIMPFGCSSSGILKLMVTHLDIICHNLNPI